MSDHVPILNRYNSLRPRKKCRLDMVILIDYISLGR